MNWYISYRTDPYARELADRHYNRQKIGSEGFVPPGRCLVLSAYPHAVWVTSWPYAEYVKHAWAGAWVNSLFRRESGQIASESILQAIAATRWYYGDPPPLGMITFVDPKKVKPTKRRGQTIYGYCYIQAGFEHVGYTGSGLWAYQLLPDQMPAPVSPLAHPRGCVGLRPYRTVVMA